MCNSGAMEREPDHRVNDKEEARRQAYRMNRLVDEGVVSSSEASAVRPVVFDTILEDKFDKDHWQSVFRAEKVDHLRHGQKMERKAVCMLEEALPALHIGARIRRATVQEDEGRMQDAHLLVDGLDEEFHVQITTKTGIDAEKKAVKLAARHPETTLMIIPSSEAQLTPGTLVGMLFNSLRHNHDGLRAYGVLIERMKTRYPKQAAAFLQ